MRNYLTSRLQTIPWLPQLRDAGHSPWLPLALLLLALSTVFIFANDRGAFYRPGHHDGVTADHLTVAANMSPSHYFLGFQSRRQLPDGSIAYDAYNRFPVGSYLLMKLFILPFPDQSLQIYSVRILMLLFFAGAALLAYQSLRRLTGHRWISFTATLFALAAPYWLYYNDMVSSEVSPDFFGMMLTFHGMIIFLQEGRFRQLLVKSVLAILLGWHIFALLLPFILIGLVSELIRARAAAPEASPLTRLRAALTPLLRSRYLTLGIVAFLCGVAMLGFNLVNEYYAFRGEKGLTELPSFGSLLYRSGQNAGFNAVYADRLAWPSYLQDQLYRIGGMATPYALPGYFNDLGQDTMGDLGWHGVILGLAVTALALLGLAFVSHKILWATLVLSGFCWAALFRGSVAFHSYEFIVYAGIPLAAGSFLLLYLSRPGGRRFIAALAAIALLVFGLSAFRMAQVGHAEIDSQFQEVAAADFQVILAATEGHTVAYRGQLPRLAAPVRHYLAGSLEAGPTAADFLILPLRLAGVESLTPYNRHIFLYPGGPAALWNYLDRILAQAGPPLLDSDYAVHYYAGRPYLPDDWLFYVKNPCQPQDRREQFFLHLVPQDPSDLPPDRWQYGFANLDFKFNHYAWSSRERCIAGIPLPPYPIAQIRTGQYLPDAGPIWQGAAALPPAR